MSNKKNPGLTRRASGLMALEPRFMFDGAAVDTAHDQLADTAALDRTQAVNTNLFRLDASNSNLTSAAQLAQMPSCSRCLTAGRVRLTRVGLGA
jgi:hypothetical protein